MYYIYNEGWGRLDYKESSKKMADNYVNNRGGFVMGILVMQKALNLITGKIMKDALDNTRATLYGDMSKEKHLPVDFGERIAHEIRFGTKEGETFVQDYLDAGCDPNYCLLLAES